MIISAIPAFVATADPPFNRQDIVLRSEDGIDFYTFKAYLSSASEVFNHLLSSATPNGELADGLPIIPFYDPSTVLRGLLCYCDPNIDSRSCSAPLIDVQNLAIKYDMRPVARAVYRDRIRLERDLPLFPSDMLSVIRQWVGQDEDVCLAAAITFTYENEVPKEMVDVDLVTQTQFDSLVRYRKDCCAKAVSVASPEYTHFTWMSPTYNWFRPDMEHDNNCKLGGKIFIASVEGKLRTRDWWMSYISKAKSRLEMRPWGSTVTSGDFFDQALKEGSQCSCCEENLDRDFRQFTNIFAREIDNAVSQARYRILLSAGNLLLISIFGVGCVDVGCLRLFVHIISIFRLLTCHFFLATCLLYINFISLPLSYIALVGISGGNTRYAMCCRCHFWFCSLFVSNSLSGEYILARY